MASNPIGRGAPVVTLPGTLPPMPAVMRILARHDRHHLAAFVAVAIDLMDAMEGDPEAEPATWPEAIDARDHDSGLPEDSEAAGDEADAAWPEWQTRGRHKLFGGLSEAPGTIDEDTEDDDPDTGVEDDPQGFDPEEDYCAAGDDCVRSGSITRAGLVCEDLGPGDADDAEHWQQTENVPMPQVWSADHNIFNDTRTYLGRSNLMTSFRTNGGEDRSADTGATFVSRADGGDRKPGVPV